MKMKLNFGINPFQKQKNTNILNRLSRDFYDPKLAGTIKLTKPTKPTIIQDSTQKYRQRHEAKISMKAKSDQNYAQQKPEFGTLNSSILAKNRTAMEYLLVNPDHLGNLGDFFNESDFNRSLCDVFGAVLNPEDFTYPINFYRFKILVQKTLMKLLFDNEYTKNKYSIFANLNGGLGFWMEEIYTTEDCKAKIRISIELELKKLFHTLSNSNLQLLANIATKMIVALAEKGLPEHIDLDPKKI